MRRKQALAYLREAALSMSEVADRLDFTTMAAFHRAFRRWTGITPGDYRDRAGEESTR